MGSSGSYLVALLKAIHTFKKEYVSTQELAEEACQIEIDKLKRPVGKQDQYMAAFGGITKLKIGKSGKVKVKKLELAPDFVRELENSMLVFYTGIHREGKDILKKQSKSTRENNKRTIENLHLIKTIGLKIERALINNDIDSVGKLMHEHWMCKRNLSNDISSSRIDRLYQLGIENGALGGKIMGAGGGGFLLFVCPENRQKIRTAMARQGLQELFYRFEMEGAKVIADLS